MADMNKIKRIEGGTLKTVRAQDATIPLNVQTYSGPYTVTPTTEQQTLNTQNRILSANVTVEGVMNDYDGLENKPQVNGVTLQGNKSLEDLGIASAEDVQEKYTKPDSGIPASDIADGVIPDVSGFYTKPAGGIPATDIASGVIPDVSGFYTKPSTGIPATDIASGVIPDVSGFYEKPSTGIPATDIADGVIPDVSGFYTKPAAGIPASDIASGVIPDVTGKLDAPSTAGTQGQVLTSDGNGGQSWQTIQSVTVDSTLSVSGAAADAKVTGEIKNAVTEINDAIVNPHWSNNLFYYNTSTIGYALRLSDGASIKYQACCYTDYIPVSAGDVVYRNFYIQSGTYGDVYYNESKQIIETVPSHENMQYHVAPQNAKYVRMTFLSSNYSGNIIKTIPEISLKFSKIITDATFDAPHIIQEYGTKTGDYGHLAFPTSAIFAGKEIVMYRAAHRHLSDTSSSNWGCLMADIRGGDGKWVHFGEVDLSDVSFNGEPRDPKLTVSRDGDRLFLSFFSTFNTDHHDSVICELDSSLSVADSYVISDTSDIICGNVLITPSGYMLFSTYGSGNVKVYRSTAAFTSLSSVQFGTPISLHSSQSGYTETCLGYWGSKYLVAVTRNETAAARYVMTEELEGTSGWTQDAALDPGLVLHAPMLVPYWADENVLPIVGSKVESSNRKPVFGMLALDSGSLGLIGYGLIYDGQRYGGYPSITYYGGGVFGSAYYDESQLSTSSSYMHTSTLMAYVKYYAVKKVDALNTFFDGGTGADGTTFTPSVSSAGVISWTNDGGKSNPASVDLVAAVIAALPSAVGVSF